MYVYLIIGILIILIIIMICNIIKICIIISIGKPSMESNINSTGGNQATKKEKIATFIL